jgi:hypothetical protein
MFAVLAQTQDETAFCLMAKLCPCTANHIRHHCLIRLDPFDVDDGELPALERRL